MRTREMSLINCQINLILTCSGSCAISSGNAANQTTTLAITHTNLYVPVLTQLKIMENYHNDWNQVLEEQLTPININQK